MFRNIYKEKIELLEKLSGVSIDKWITDYGKLEHNWHERNADIKILEEKKKMIEENIKITEEKINLEKAKVLAETEKDYYHQLHTKIESIEQENRIFISELVKEIAKNKGENRVEIIK